jgi:nucleoside-diphosphate-sugar epimerase
MIVGSGLLAQAFLGDYAEAPDVWIYAAGVSNSACTDPTEFARERARLEKALEESRDSEAFVYFSTCSIDDASAANSQYVRHKVAMEARVAEHGRHLIARLPQVAGRTPNPHTLLNYLYARIARSEQFVAWTRATRNVIDVSDVASTVSRLIESADARRVTVNVANPKSVAVAEIVAALEAVVGKPAVVQWIDAGSDYRIDVGSVMPTYRELKLDFDENYLYRVTEKYYGN